MNVITGSPPDNAVQVKEETRDQSYSNDFYKAQQDGSLRSAKEIVPLVLELLQPKSVVDVGCGVGTWLSVFNEGGIEDILGIDGDWVDKKMLQISEERFLSFDLRKPLDIDRQFDLVLSLEVAEHLQSKYAGTFIDSLTRLGPCILFSAAIPFQGGTNHVNEQWPDYWVKFFQDKGYVVIDCIRKKVWQNDNVEWWYAQNILLFVRQECLANYPLLKTEFENTVISQLSMIHPKYLDVVEKRGKSPDPIDISLRQLLSALPTLAKKLYIRG